MLQRAEHGTREAIIGGAGRFMAASFFLTPRIAERLFSAQTNRDHTVKEERVPPTAGNLFKPPTGDTGVTGGWVGSRGPDVPTGAVVASLAITEQRIRLVRTRALLASSHPGHVGA